MEVEVVRVHVDNDPPVVLVSEGLVDYPLERVAPLQLDTLFQFLRVLPLQDGNMGSVILAITIDPLHRAIFVVSSSKIIVHSINNLC